MFVKASAQASVWGSSMVPLSAQLHPTCLQHCLHPEVVDQYLEQELTKHRLLGPFQFTSDLPSLHINRFGVIPKGHNTGKWRLITDLTFPSGVSVNDGIDPELCSLSYIMVDDIAAMASKLGPSALLANVDIESAYRSIPVSPSGTDHSWLCNGEVASMSTQCSPLAFGQRQKSLTQ